MKLQCSVTITVMESKEVALQNFNKRKRGRLEKAYSLGGGREGVIGRMGKWVSGLLSVLEVQFFIYIKENWICNMSRYHAEPNISIIILTRNLPFDSDVRQ